MESAQEAVRLLKDCDRLTEFLEFDLRSRNEVGFCLGEDGSVFEFREGSWSQMTVVLPSTEPEARRIVVHTHPSIDMDVTFSESDASLCEHEAVCGLIVLSQEMFDVTWNGRALTVGVDGVTDEEAFSIVCDGSTDGPAEERWVENPRFE